MRRFIATIIFLSIGTSGALVAPAIPAGLPSLWSTYEHAYALKNIDEMLSLFSEDAIVDIQGRKPLIGSAAIRQFWVARFSETSSEKVHVAVVSISFDKVRSTAIVRGTLNGYRIVGATRRVFHTRFLDVLRQQPTGTWRVFRGMTIIDR